MSHLFLFIMKKENLDTCIPKFDFCEILYHKELIENRVFTQKEARGMFYILAQIQSALKDKSANTGNFKLNITERFWLLSIDELINQIKEPAPI